MLGQLKNLISPEVTRGLLKHQFIYRLLAGLGKLGYPNNGFRAQAIWLDFIAGQIQTALGRKELVVWGNAFFPFELLYALGVTPHRPETMAALAAKFGLSRRAIACAESGCYSPDVCSFYRCAVGLDMDGLLPRPDFIVATSCLCDGAGKVFHNFARKYGIDFYLLDVPYHETPRACTYLAGQLEELAGIIARKQGRSFQIERLQKAIMLSNEARDYLVKANELRRAVPCPLPGGDAISYVLDMQFFGPGSVAGARFFRSLYEEMARRVARKEGAVPGEKFRLLWVHYIKPYYPNEIFSFLEANGAAVVFGEANHVYWEPMDPARPFESLAARILANPSVGPLERRTETLLRLVETYGIDGVINFSHWGCRQSSGGEYVIRDLMQKKGIPVLVLDGDGADRRNYSREQTRLRLQAFLEMLEAKR